MSPANGPFGDLDNYDGSTLTEESLKYIREEREKRWNKKVRESQEEYERNSKPTPTPQWQIRDQDVWALVIAIAAIILVVLLANT